MRTPDASELTAAELGQAVRELTVSASLSRPDSPIHTPIQAQMMAIDAEILQRGLRMCSCGLATSDDEWMAGHLFDYPGHQERDLRRYFDGR